MRIVRVTKGGGSDSSYLGMWKKAVDREKEETEFQKIVENSERSVVVDEVGVVDEEALERKSNEFEKILEVSKEERDRTQRMQVIDRAAAAIAAAQAILKESVARRRAESVGGSGKETFNSESTTADQGALTGPQQKGNHACCFFSRN